MIAACRTPLSTKLAGLTRAPVTLVTPQAGSAPRHASSGKVHTPSAVPSWSHAEPSTQVVAAAVMPPQVTMQSVAAGPPPPKQSEPGQAADARRTKSKETSAIEKPRRMANLPECRNIPEVPYGVNVVRYDRALRAALPS